MQRGRLIHILLMTMLTAVVLLPVMNDTGKGEGAPESVTLETNYGTIVFELYPEEVPVTVANFVDYVEADFYTNLIFHRVIDDFMVQGGGFYRDSNDDMVQKTPIYSPIPLEIDPDLRHLDGSVAMARTSDPNSATSQFYICDGSQAFLDDEYAVFGKVTSGMNVVREIALVPTHSEGGQSDVPVDDVIIETMSVSYSSSQPSDNTGAPSVVSTTPANGDGGILVTTDVFIQFSESINISSLRSNDLTCTPGMDFEFSWSDSDRGLMLTPYKKFDYNTEYTLTVTSGFEDMGGNRMTDYQFSFRTQQESAADATGDGTGASTDDSGSSGADSGLELDTWMILAIVGVVLIVMVLLVIIKTA